MVQRSRAAASFQRQIVVRRLRGFRLCAQRRECDLARKRRRRSSSQGSSPERGNVPFGDLVRSTAPDRAGRMP